MTDIAQLGFRVDTSGLRRSQTELRNTARAGGRTERDINRNTRGMASGFERVRNSATMVRTAIAAIGGAVVVRQIQQAVRASIELGNEIDKVAQASGVGAERVQELQFAFGQLARISDQQVNQALIRFQQSLGEAQAGSERTGAAFRQMGVDLDSGTGPALERTIRQLARIESDSRRADMAARLFGRTAGPQMAAALGNGEQAVEDLAAAIRRDGGIIDQEQITAAADLADAMDRINRQVTAQRTSAVLEYRSEIEALAVAFGSVQVAAITGAASLARFGTSIGEALTAIAGRPVFTNIEMMQRQIQGVQSELEQVEQQLAAEEARRGPDLFGLRARSVQNLQERAEQLREELARLERAMAAVVPTEDAVIAPVQVEAQLRTMMPERLSPDVELADLGVDIDQRRQEAMRFFQQTRTEVEQIEAQIARVQELSAQGWFRDAGIDDQQILERLNAQLKELEENTGSAADEIQQSLAITAGGALEEMFARGEISASNFFDAVLRDIARMVAQIMIVRPLMQSLFGANVAGGTGSGVLGGAIESLTGMSHSGIDRIPREGTWLLDRGQRVMTSSQADRMDAFLDQQQRAGQMAAPKVQIIDQRGRDAPPIETQVVGDELRILVRGEVDRMFADGSIDQRFRASSMPVRRRGSR